MNIKIEAGGSPVPAQASSGARHGGFYVKGKHTVRWNIGVLVQQAESIYHDIFNAKVEVAFIIFVYP